MGAPEILGSALSFPPIETRAEFKARTAKEDAGHRPPRPRALGGRPSRGLTEENPAPPMALRPPLHSQVHFRNRRARAPTVSRPSL